MLKTISNHHPSKPNVITIICILHVVGLIGIGVFENNFILSLTWANLTITFILGLLFFEIPFKKVLIPILLAALIGLITEGIGVNTGYLFGNYEYGTAHGVKVLEVPLTIGLLWAGLNIAAKNMVSRFLKKPILIAIFAALLMVVLDVIMEPVAIKLNFWNWDQNVIPIFNYITWFCVSLFIQLLWQKVNTKNTIFEIIFIIQTIFFIALNILL